MLTLSGSLGGATCQEITTPNLRKGESQAPGGRVPRRPSFSPHCQPQPQLSRSSFVSASRPPQAGSQGRDLSLGSQGQQSPGELGGSARLCIREPTMRPPQGRPEMGPRSQDELPALRQQGSCLNCRCRSGGPAGEADSRVATAGCTPGKAEGGQAPISCLPVHILLPSTNT